MNPYATPRSVTKSPKVALLFGLLILLLLPDGENFAEALRCDRTPEGSVASKSPADGRFRIRISGNPEKYVPGESYTSKYLRSVFSNLYESTLVRFQIICSLAQNIVATKCQPSGIMNKPLFPSWPYISDLRHDSSRE